MSLIERDVISQGVDEKGNSTIDYPLGRLGWLKSAAEIKAAPGEHDYIPIVDMDDGEQMKKTPLSALSAGGGLPGKSAYQYAVEGGFAGTEAEFSALLGVKSNPNLLDNWYFLDPINQRNVSGMITTSGYFIDRWKRTGGMVKLTAGGLILHGAMVQILETAPPETVTASALTTGGIVPASYDAPAKAFIIEGTGQIFIAAKLELGSVQTLAHQDADGNWVLNGPPPNKQQELAKCQRYFQIFSSETARPASLTDYRPSMRANPALGTITIDGTTYYTADANL